MPGTPMSAWLAEPGGLQVQAALKLLAGGLAGGAVVVQAGQLGVLRGVKVAEQFPVGQAVRRRRPAPVDAARVCPIRTCKLARARSITSSAAHSPAASSSSRARAASASRSQATDSS